MRRLVPWFVVLALLAVGGGATARDAGLRLPEPEVRADALGARATGGPSVLYTDDQGPAPSRGRWWFLGGGILLVAAAYLATRASRQSGADNEHE